MGFQPWYKGCTYPALPIPLNTDSAADIITGISVGNFTMTMRNVGSSTPTDTTGTGTFTIVSTSPAQVNYQFSSADVASAGTFKLIVKATFPGAGGGVAIYDPIDFVITDD